MIVVKNCTIDNMYYAMLGFRGYKTFIMENVVSDVFFGIGVSHLEGSIKGNVLNNVTSTGIHVDFGDLAHVVNNTVYMSAGSTGKGLEFYRMNSSNIIGNTIDGGNRGIYLQEMVSCTIIGNTISNASIVGIYSWTNCFYNYIGLNSFRSVPTYYDFTLSPTNYFFGDDTVYGAGWNGDLGTPTKNVVYDKINTMDGIIAGKADNPHNNTQHSETYITDVVQDTTPQLGGNLDAQSLYRINNLVDPAANQDAATRKFVDDHNWTEADITDLGAYLENIVEDTTPQLGGNLDLNGHGIVYPSKTITDFKDEDDMASDSDVYGATQQSIKAYIDALRTEFEASNAIGAANAQFIPLGATMSHPADAISNANNIEMWSNVSTGTINVLMSFPKTTTLGSKKLYVSGTRLILSDADANNKVTSTVVYGVSSNGGITALDTDNTAKDSEGTHDDTFTAVDCSSYSHVLLWIITSTNTAYALACRGAFIKCYYDD